MLTIYRDAWDAETPSLVAPLPADRMVVYLRASGVPCEVDDTDWLSSVLGGREVLAPIGEPIYRFNCPTERAAVESIAYLL